MQDDVTHTKLRYHYLSLILDTTLDKKSEEFTGEELLYCFPTTALSPEFQRVVGLFLGLKDISHEFLGEKIQIVSFEEGQFEFKLKAGYIILHDCMLVILLPLDFSNYLLSSIIQDFWDFLSFSYGSIGALLKGKAADSDDTTLASGQFTDIKETLNQVFVHFFGGLFSPVSNDKKFFGTFSEAVPCFPLPLGMHTKVDNIMTELETAERTVAEMFMEDPRLCLIIGSIFIVRGAVIVTHLSTAHTRQVYRFCKYMGLFSRSPHEMEQQIIQEVFLTKSTEERPEDMVVHRNRKMLVVLAQEDTVLAMLLHPSGPPQGEIDPYYIQDIREAMSKIRAQGAVENVKSLWRVPAVAQKPLSNMIPSNITHTDLPFMIGSELKNSVCYYVSVHNITGLILFGNQKSSHEWAALQEAFYKNCTFIRQVFASQKKANPGSQAPMEFGMKVGVGNEQCWMVGRSTSQGEFFVCRTEGVPQSAAELAFKVQFGFIG